jgi:hypothetical protein
MIFVRQERNGDDIPRNAQAAIWTDGQIACSLFCLRSLLRLEMNGPFQAVLFYYGEKEGTK